MRCVVGDVDLYDCDDGVWFEWALWKREMGRPHGFFWGLLLWYIPPRHFIIFYRRISILLIIGPPREPFF